MPNGCQPRVTLRLLALLAALLAIGCSVGSDSATPDTDVTRALDELATLAEAEGAIAEGTFRRTRYDVIELEIRRLRNVGDEGYSALVPKQRDVWMRSDGCALVRDTDGAPIFAGERDRQRWIADGQSTTPTGTERPGGVNLGGALHLGIPPRQPSELRDWSAAQFDMADDSEAFDMFGDLGNLLIWRGADPQSRAVLFRLIGTIPGTERVPDTIDPAGRSGTAFRVTGRKGDVGMRRTLFIDPQTSQLLAFETELLEQVSFVDKEPPNISTRAVAVATDAVDAIPPEARLLPARGCTDRPTQ